MGNLEQGFRDSSSILNSPVLSVQDTHTHTQPYKGIQGALNQKV